jgi:hypothetical protein
MKIMIKLGRLAATFPSATWERVGKHNNWIPIDITGRGGFETRPYKTNMIPETNEKYRWGRPPGRSIIAALLAD